MGAVPRPALGVDGRLKMVAMTTSAARLGCLEVCGPVLGFVSPLTLAHVALR